MLDMHLSAQIIDPSTLKLFWRHFTGPEKKFIDGIQIRYRIADNDNDDDWTFTDVLHRNTVAHTLHQLEPGVSYACDLVFIPIEGIDQQTNIVSTKPILVDMPTLSSTKNDDNFKFEVHFYHQDVSMDDDGKITVVIHNLPRPIHKYVNLVKVYFQNVHQNSDQFGHEYVGIDENGQVKFGGRTSPSLRTNTRYKIWMDLYLTNGQVMSSNSLEILVHFKHPEDEFNGENALLATPLNPLESKYALSIFMVISAFIFIIGSIFMMITCYFVRVRSKQSSISSSPLSTSTISEAAYDNPTYKTFESPNEKSSSFIITTATTAASNGGGPQDRDREKL